MARQTWGRAAPERAVTRRVATRVRPQCRWCICNAESPDGQLEAPSRQNLGVEAGEDNRVQSRVANVAVSRFTGGPAGGIWRVKLVATAGEGDCVQGYGVASVAARRSAGGPA